PIPNAPGGTSNAGGSGGASAGNSSSGGGGAGAGVVTAGSGGQPVTGGAAGASAGNAGASMGGSSGAGGMGGSAGAGGDPNLPELPKRMLLYHFSTLDIGSIEEQLALLESQLEGWGFEVVVSEDPADINAANLATFGGVGMINTCFEPFGAGQSGEAEAAALKTFVENGGGLFGTHCATVTFRSADPPHAYNQLIGGLASDGTNSEATSACRKTDEPHVATEMLPATFDYTGNLDNADYVAPDTKVLVMCKWSNNGMKDTAVSWYRVPGQGRVFYTNFAKEDVDLDEATIGQKHILLGLRWTLRL
ncbi:MAG TPA: ThuA domain-containing protein, partial [Polyangiaceae bacterium]|nr:ThuA domain-containing protein [Polyangiaceae bacterium]